MLFGKAFTAWGPVLCKMFGNSLVHSGDSSILPQGWGARELILTDRTRLSSFMIGGQGLDLICPVVCIGRPAKKCTTGNVRRVLRHAEYGGCTAYLTTFTCFGGSLSLWHTFRTCHGTLLPWTAFDLHISSSSAISKKVVAQYSVVPTHIPPP